MIVVTCQIHEILMDNESSTNILYMEIFWKMNIEKDKLRLIKTPFMGFGAKIIVDEKSIQLPFTITETPDQVTSIVDFLVIDCPSVYNMIMGRPFLNLIIAVTFTYTLVIKFLMGSRVGTVKVVIPHHFLVIVNPSKELYIIHLFEHSRLEISLDVGLIAALELLSQVICCLKSLNMRAKVCLSDLKPDNK